MSGRHLHPQECTVVPVPVDAWKALMEVYRLGSVLAPKTKTPVGSKQWSHQTPSMGMTWTHMSAVVKYVRGVLICNLYRSKLFVKVKFHITNGRPYRKSWPMYTVWVDQYQTTDPATLVQWLDRRIKGGNSGKSKARSVRVCP